MANRYLVPGGTGDYDSTTNWSTTSGGASGASKPVAADAIIIDANSLNAPLTVNTLNACLSIDCSNYTGSLVVNNVLSINGTGVSGLFRMSTGMTITGSGTIRRIITAAGTGIPVIQSNSVIIDCNVEFVITASLTNINTVLTGAAVFNKNLLFSTVSTTVNFTFSSGGLSIGGDLTYNHRINLTTTSFIGSTSCTILPNASTSTIGGNLVFNKSGGATFNINNLYTSTSSATYTYTAGIPNHTGTIFTNSGITWNTSGMKWNIIQYNTVNVFSASQIRAITLQKVAVANWSFQSNIGGIDVDNFSFTVSGILRFRSLTTVKINNSFIVTGAIASSIIVSASTASSPVTINLGSNAFMKIHRATFTDIIASNKTLRALVTTLLRTVNVFKLDSNINAYSTTR